MTDDLARRVVVTRFKAAKVAKTPSKASRRAGNSADYLDIIRTMPSCISGCRPCEPHHLTGGPAAKERGVGMKATDQWVLPVTRQEHDEIHKRGSRAERKQFADRGVDDCYALAAKLYAARSSPARMRQILETGGD